MHDDEKIPLHEAENRFTKARTAAAGKQNLNRPDAPPKPPAETDDLDIPQWAVSKTPLVRTAHRPDKKAPAKRTGFGRNPSREFFNELILPIEDVVEETPVPAKSLDDTFIADQDMLLDMIEALPELIPEPMPEPMPEPPAESLPEESHAPQEPEKPKKPMPRFSAKQNPIGEEATILSRAGQRMQNALTTHSKRLAPIPPRKPEPEATTIKDAISIVSTKPEPEPESNINPEAFITPNEPKIVDAPQTHTPAQPIRRRSEAGRRRAANKIADSGSQWVIDESRYEKQDSQSEKEPDMPDFAQDRPERSRSGRQKPWQAEEPPRREKFTQLTEEPPRREKSPQLTEEPTIPIMAIKPQKVRPIRPQLPKQADELQKSLVEPLKKWPNMEPISSEPVLTEPTLQEPTQPQSSRADIALSHFDLPEKEIPEVTSQHNDFDQEYAEPDMPLQTDPRNQAPPRKRRAARQYSDQGGQQMPTTRDEDISSGGGGDDSGGPQSRLWMLPVALVLIGALFFGGYRGYIEYDKYMVYAEQKRLILQMEKVVNVDTFYEGVVIDGRNVAGYTYEEVRDAFTKRDQSSVENFAITLIHGDRKFVIDAQIADYHFDTEETVARAYAMGRSSDLASLASRYNEVMRIKSEGANFSISSQYDLTRIQDYVNQVANELYIPATDAKVSSFDEGSKSFTFTSEKSGLSIDAASLYQSVLAALEESRLTASITVPATELTPKVTRASLEGNFGLITSFSTTTTSDSKRNTNIKLATTAINGTMLAPGEIFYFNKATGERTPEKGYQEAGAIKNGVLIKEPGGGVCQVSSTLFVAAAKADLEIMYRINHTWPSSYVAIGLDATVDWPGVDFTFRNSKSASIYIRARFNDQKLTIEIYGQKLEPGLEINLESTVTGTQEPAPPKYQTNANLKPGEKVVIKEARTGSSATTYKVYYKNGEKVKTVELCRSVYPPVQGIIEVPK